MSNERDELAVIIDKALCEVTGIFDTTDAENAELAEEILKAGYRKPRTIFTAEKLDALPIGSVVLSDSYHSDVDGTAISFQRWYDGLWHRGARSSDTHPDNFLPAIVLYEPQP